jgi:hypothetical protein
VYRAAIVLPLVAACAPAPNPKPVAPATASASAAAAVKPPPPSYVFPLERPFYRFSQDRIAARVQLDDATSVVLGARGERAMTGPRRFAPHVADRALVSAQRVDGGVRFVSADGSIYCGNRAIVNAWIGLT